MDNWTSKYNFLAALIIAGATGFISLSGGLTVLASTAAFPAAMSLVKSRRESFAVAFFYYTFAMHTIYVGIYDHTGNLIITLLLPSLAFFILSVPYALLNRYGFIGFGAALILVAIPPIGHIGWAHPLTSAGLYFPGFGFYGLLAFFLVLLVVYYKPITALALPFFIAYLTINPPVVSEAQPWRPINTKIGNLIQSGFNPFQDYKAHSALLPIVRASTNSHILLPEGAFGLWNKVADQLWRSNIDLESKTIIAGGETKTGDGQFYNSLILIDELGSKPVYHSRVPIPYFMKRNKEGYFKSHDNLGYFDYKGARYGAILCYEISLVWTVLQTHWHKPDQVLVSGNKGWSSRTNVDNILDVASASWSLLFDTPYATAVNE